MAGDLTGVIVAVVAFAVTFGIARMAAAVWRKKRQVRTQAEALRGQSRQVRRAQARRHQR